jgi:Ser/Thr protein kinase RdoA (MazF antagonist)/AraC-like DNA-binding protein
LEYIEANLRTDISATELASAAGYSVWHYYEMFRRMTGMPVARYILKRRLDRALADISSGMPSIDAALLYGFDTYSGFYRAFVKMYGCSPKKYLSIYGKTKTEAKTMFTEQQLREILTNWDISQDLPIRDIYITDGTKVSPGVWSVGSEYILKTDERDKILRNLRINKALADQGFAAAAPITTKSGADYVDDEHIIVLSRGIPGNPLEKSDRFGENRERFGEKYGAAIAKLHIALASIEGDVEVDEVNLFRHVAEWALPEVRRQNEQWKLGLSDEFFSDYSDAFGELFPQLPKQLIHRDPNPSNILFHGGEVSGFVDFDLAERNIRLWDVCYCATGILSEWRGVDNINELWFDVLRGILRGYDSVSPLTSAERQAVYYVICSIQQICIAYFESVPKYRELAKSNREMLMFIVQNKGRICAAI